MKRLEALVGKTGKVDIIINDKLCFTNMDISRAAIVTEGLDYTALKVSANKARLYI